MTLNATDRCSKSEVSAVDGNIGGVPVTASPTHIQPVAAALSDKMVDPQSDVVANRDNKKALMVQPVGVLNVEAVVSVVVDRIGVSRISRTVNPSTRSIRS